MLVAATWPVAFVVADQSPTLSDPVGLLISQGITPILVLILLWRGWLFLPSKVKDIENYYTALLEAEKRSCDRLIDVKDERIGAKDKQIADLTRERDVAIADGKELQTWVRVEAVPLVTRSTDLMKQLAEALAESAPPPKLRARKN